MARRPTATSVLAVGLAASLTLPLSGCGDSATDSARDPGTLRVLDYYNNEPDFSVFGGVIDQCGQQLGVEVERQTIPGGDLIPSVLQQASSETLPDVLMLDNPDLPQIAQTGALVPLDEYGIDTDGYAPGVVTASTYQDRLYGLQPVTNTLALFVNTRMLDEAGVEPPRTWQELREVAARLADDDRYGVAFAATNTYEGTWQFMPFAWSNGGDEMTLDSAANVEALQLWVDLVHSGSASESVVNWSQDAVSDQFAAGNAAMMINGPWQFPILDEVDGLDYEVVPLPVPEQGDELVLPFGGETWVVPRTPYPEKHETAARMVECINAEDNMVVEAAERDTLPTRLDLVDEVVAQRPRLQPFADALPELRSRTGELGAQWPDTATRIYTAVQYALVGGMTPAEALSQAQEGR